MKVARYIVFCLLVAVFSLAAKSVPQNSDLSPGQTRYRVGFRQMKLSDSSRPFGESKSRAVRVSLWYPAVPGSGQVMNLKSYVELHQSEEQPDGVPAFREWARMMRTEESRIEPLLELASAACSDATPMSGRFPLIVYAASFRAPAYENFALFEDLAGQGFVVIAIPSVGNDATGMTMNKIGVESQFRDFELAYRQALELPFVEKGRVGTMGFSLGAVSAALLALKDHGIRACVSIDGGMQYTYALLGGSLGRADEKLNAAYLQLTQRPTPLIRLDNKFYDSHAVSNACHFQWKKLDHYDFASLTLLLRSARPKDYKPSEREIELNGVNETTYGERFLMHKQMTRIIYFFFDAHLRNSAESKRELRRLIKSKLPEHDGIFSIRTMK